MSIGMKPSDIDVVEEGGILDGNPVKLVRTKGGFWIAISRKKGSPKDEALTAGSHPAIVKFNLEKMFPGFQPSMMKSELYSDNIQIEKHSHFLSEPLRKSGYDIFSLEEGNSIDFHIVRHGIQVAEVKGTVEDNALKINELDFPEQFSRAMAGATTEKSISKGLGKIKVGK